MSRLPNIIRSVTETLLSKNDNHDALNVLSLYYQSEGKSSEVDFRNLVNQVAQQRGFNPSDQSQSERFLTLCFVRDAAQLNPEDLKISKENI